MTSHLFTDHTGGGFRSAKPFWCQQGYAGVVALAALS
jgi:hypothetical protein